MEKANNANEMSNEFKKFSLKNVEDFLSDNEMKNTRGGSGEWGTCAAITPGGEDRCGFSKVQAMFWATCQDLVNGTNCNGGHWCCDSCGTASWYTCG